MSTYVLGTRQGVLGKLFRGNSEIRCVLCLSLTHEETDRGVGSRSHRGYGCAAGGSHGSQLSLGRLCLTITVEAFSLKSLQEYNELGPFCPFLYSEDCKLLPFPLIKENKSRTLNLIIELIQDLETSKCKTQCIIGPKNKVLSLPCYRWRDRAFVILKTCPNSHTLH